MINEEAIKAYLFKEFKGIINVDIKKLGSGVQGSGFLLEMETAGGLKSYVVKRLFPEGLGHDYPSDRAAVFLLDLDEYNDLPKHVKAVDVLSEMQDGTIRSIGGGKEYYLLMERGEGRDYFNDLAEFQTKKSLDNADIEKIKAMASYLAEIHSVKKDSRPLYWRKIRDTIGHGECLMGVFDTYPDGTLSYGEMAEIEKLCIDWRARLKPMHHRLSQIHGDFHPGNIWFKEDSYRVSSISSQQSAVSSHPPLARGGKGGVDFILLDRSRGPWGEPADDVTALAINYIFFSIKNYGDVRGTYFEGLRLFFDEYIKGSGDPALTSIVAPFFAFRAVVVANPIFYPDLSEAARKKIFTFTRNVLSEDNFEVARINEYLDAFPVL